MTRSNAIAGLAAGMAWAMIGVGSAPVAHAQDIASRYTSAATKACRTISQSKDGEGDWATWSCQGVDGLVVRVTEDDLRMTVSVGRTAALAEKEPAASQSFGPFNSAGDTIEWRGVAGSRPFAIIQRWMIADSANEGPDGRPRSVGLLVVTRLGPGAVCHAAYIDVRANAEPNVLARKAADEGARSFDCRNKPAVLGNRGRAIALAVR